MFQQQDEEQTRRLIKDKDMLSQSLDLEPYEDKEPVPNRFLGMNLKKETTKQNVLAIFLSWFVFAAINGFANAQMVYLLRDEDYFEVIYEDQEKISASIYLGAIATAFVYAPFAGWFYDLYGRNFLMFSSTVIAAYLVAILPLTAPSVITLGIVRCAIEIFLTQLICNPLIADYIKQDSRGRASAIQSFGALLGQLFSVVCLVGISSNEKLTQSDSYGINATILGCIGAPLAIIVTDVKIKSARTDVQAGIDNF